MTNTPLNLSKSSGCAGQFESSSEIVVDCVGIGFGPANIAIAVALEEMGYQGSVLFIERNTAPDWQPEMLLEGADIQHNPLRDFVTPRNPKSEYGFLNYLKHEGRLWDFFNLEAFPPRTEYARYVRWVARHFDDRVAYGDAVQQILLTDDPDGTPRVKVVTSSGKTVLAKSLLFAPGRSPYIPPVFENLCGDRVIHFTNYLTATSRWEHENRLGKVAVVGASQSAAEIVLDLTSRFPKAQVENIFRSFGYQLKDTSPFTEHIYFPEFVDHFHAADPANQAEMTEDLWRSNYGSADRDVIHHLYMKRYDGLISGRKRIDFRGNQDILSAKIVDEKIEIELMDTLLGQHHRTQVDSVVLATGFCNFGSGLGQEVCHPLLKSIHKIMRKRHDDTLFVTRDYRLMAQDESSRIPLIFLNGVCESTHGFGDAGSFSLLSIRSWLIATSLTKGLSGNVATPGNEENGNSDDFQELLMRDGGISTYREENE